MNLIYQSINLSVLSRIPLNTQNLLDVGCGSGVLGREIKKHLDCQIMGVTYSSQEASLASKTLDHVLVHDLNSLDTNNLPVFDCIVCCHVLEHLYQPERLLKQLRNNLTSEGCLIIALPNVLHWKQRLDFLKGNFKYTEGGLMDRTHFRFFDWDTALDLVQESGFKIIVREADGYFPLPGIRSLIKPLALKIDRFTTRLLPGLLGVQFIIVAQVA